MPDDELNGAPWKDRRYREKAGENGKDNSYAPKRRFPIVAFADIAMSSDCPYLIKGLIPRDGLVVVWGPPKCGKTFWTFDVAMHIALGWEYRGRGVTSGTVIYIACEGERGLAARVEAFRREKMGQCHDHVPFHLLTTRLDLVAEVGALIGDLTAQLGEDGCAAIVIDTLNRSLAGSESSDEDMGAYIKAADAIREAFRCVVIVIHHCGVDDRRPRGHTSLAGAVDAQIAIRRDDGIVVAAVEFMKDGETGAEVRSVLKVVELGRDDDDDPVTSCVIEPADSAAVQKQRRPVRVTGAPKVAFNILRKAIDEAGQPAPASDHIAGHLRVVPLEIWRRYAYAGSVTDSDKPDAQRKAFGRAVTKLQALGLVGIWSEFAWLTE